MQHGLSVDDTVDEWVAFMENQQSPEITEDVVYKFESKVCMNVCNYIFSLPVWHEALLQYWYSVYSGGGGMQVNIWVLVCM